MRGGSGARQHPHKAFTQSPQSLSATEFESIEVVQVRKNLIEACTLLKRLCQLVVVV
jgi:hypothetical protein